jgi:alkyl hydroperoxide reductase subunit AhpC
MGCRCQERADAMRRAVVAGNRGEVRAIVRETAYVGRTLREDLRSGALLRAAQNRVSLFRGRR